MFANIQTRTKRSCGLASNEQQRGLRTLGWKEQLDAVDRSLHLSHAFLLYEDRRLLPSA